MNTKEGAFYACPNQCDNNCFYQNGTMKAVKKFFSTIEENEIETFDFTPDKDIPVKCLKCDAVAIKKMRKVTITEEVIN